jgi:uncharacterized iron-regulated membrane protein
MKLSRHTFVRMWDVHAWVGVVSALVLHVMFFAGGFALFLEDLNAWQEPAPAEGTTSQTRLLPLETVVTNTLAARAANPATLSLGFSPAFVTLHWPVPGQPEWAEVRVDRRTGALVPLTSQVGELLYWLHFLYHPKAPWGMQVAGGFAVALLLALVTGVLIHIKDIVRQFHQFRPARTVRVLWSDLHKVLGVMGLPFQAMFAFTGAMLGLSALLLGAFVGPVFDGNESAAGEALWGRDPQVKASGKLGPGLSLDQLLARAQARFPGLEVTFAQVQQRGDANAVVKFWGERRSSLFARGQLSLRASDGFVVSETFTGRDAAPGASVLRWVVGLHYALYGGLATKLLYALLALATCLVLLSGNWIWLQRRQATHAHPGNQLLARLTLGAGGGVILATAALFLTNRLAGHLAGSELRMTAESTAFFAVWGLTAAAFCARQESRSGWVGLLRVSGVAFALVPVASVILHRDHVLNFAAHGRIEVLGVECGLLVLAATLLAAATLLQRWDHGKSGQRSATGPHRPEVSARSGRSNRPKSGTGRPGLPAGPAGAPHQAGVSS